MLNQGESKTLILMARTDSFDKRGMNKSTGIGVAPPPPDYAARP